VLTLHLNVPPSESAQALAIESGEQQTVTVPGISYRDALQYADVEITWHAIPPVQHWLKFRRKIVSVTTALQSINGKLITCAVFILGPVLGQPAGTPQGDIH